jgi:AraC family transcriptional regulator
MTARKTPSARMVWDGRIGKARRYMRLHAAESLTLQRIAREAAASPYHFGRMFHAMTGETPFGYVTRTRLVLAAAMLLEDRRVPVTDVALAVGYETPSAFNKAFRFAVGVSPTGLRKLSPGARTRVLKPLDDPYRSTSMPLDITPVPEFETRPDLHFVYVRTLGRYGEQAPQAWGDLHRLLSGTNLVEPASAMIGACWDDANLVGEDALRYDAGVTVSRVPAKLPKGLQHGTLPGGRHARFVYRGPYPHLGQAFDQVLKGWVASSGAVLRKAPCLEIYLNNPEVTPDAERLTALVLPIK